MSLLYGLEPGRDRLTVQELADAADALVDRFGSDAEQGGDGDLGQGQAVVEDGGQEPVSQGEDGPAAGAGSGQAGAVAAAFAQAGFALLVMQGQQGGDQVVPLRGGQAGQGWVDQPGKVGAGLVERAGNGADLVVGLGAACSSSRRASCDGSAAGRPSAGR